MSADEYLSSQIQEFESTTLETTLGAFCESIQLARCIKCGKVKVVHADENISSSYKHGNNHIVHVYTKLNL